MSKVLILSGGGAFGSFQVGVYKQFMREGWIPDAVGGISVGALVGSMIATGQEDAMIKVWENISPDQVHQKNNLLDGIRKFIPHKIGVQLFGQREQLLAYYSNAPLRELLEKNIGSRFTMDFYCGTVDTRYMRYRSHHARRMMSPYPFIDAIMGSTAIPMVFNPVNVNGIPHIDGGVRHMTPIGTMLDRYNPTEIRIVVCNPYRGYKAEDHGRIKDIVDLGQRSLQAALNELFMKDLREFEKNNRLVQQAHKNGYELRHRNGKPYRHYQAKLYEPSQSLGDSMNFGKKQALANIEHGENAQSILL